MNEVTKGLSTAQEFEKIVKLLIGNRRDEGLERAIATAARRLGLSPRRVKAVRNGEVRRVWADELEQAREAYRNWLGEEEGRSVLRACLSTPLRLVPI